MPRRTLITLALLIPTPACVPTLSPQAASIREQVPESCKLVDSEIRGGSWLNGWIFPALERAKAEALEQAAERGATHVQWMVLDEALTGATAIARAYACD